MSAPFDQRIDVALGDLHLQRVLSQVAVGFTEVRNRAAAQLPEWEELRNRANSIKREAIENLSHYLDQMETAVRARGGEVFRAADARAACDYIARVAERRGVRLAVKSKSMATEEVELNHALEARGVEVVETDLGEFIIQLAGEKPSHIVAPAIHKTRQDVAQLFREKLHVEVDDDIPRLTATARAVLRQKFLSAGMGVTGANFGVAETGTIVIVENEGNARLTNSLPAVHVALMGIEKVIPRLADLGVFLKILARSSTGQKMTSYVSFLTGPRRAGEPDGPEEFHLVLLDNGRSKLLGHPLRREALYCIRCGACLNVCPVYRKIGGHAYPWVYSGPIGAVLTPQILGPEAEPALPFASSLCGACREVCPVKIRIPELLIELRRQEVESAPQRHRWEKLAFRLWAWAMERPWAYELGGRALRVLGTNLPGPASVWARTRELPEPAGRSFRELWRRR